MNSGARRLSCNNESIFHGARICQDIAVSSDKLSKARESVDDNSLHGRHVDVFIANSIHECVIESGCEGLYSFQARDLQTRAVRKQFTTEQAKQLRMEGVVANVTLIN